MSFANNFLYNEKASFVAFFDLPPFLTANCSFLPDFIQKNLFKICLKNYLFVSISLFGFQWSFYFRHTPSLFASFVRLSALPTWWAQVDSNHRPRAYQARALTCWAMSPFSLPMYLVHLFAIFVKLSLLVEMMGFEPMTPCLQGRCSPSWATPPYRVFLFTVPENWTTGDLLNLFLVKSIWVLREYLHILTFTIERRWSSRTFWYGYLVTT